MVRRVLMVAALVAGALAMVPGARAGLLATYDVNGGGTVTGCSGASGTSCSYSATVSGVTITLNSAQSNSPGGGTPCVGSACILSSTTSITNAGTSSATIVLTIGDIGFTSPTAPPTLDLHSQIGGSVAVAGASNLLSFVSCVNGSNAQNSCTGGISAAALTPSITATGSYNASNNTLVSTLASPYSMTEVLDITLSAGSTFNYSASSTLSPVPEPASLTLFGVALLGLGLFFGLRRKEL